MYFVASSSLLLEAVDWVDKRPHYFTLFAANMSSFDYRKVLVLGATSGIGKLFNLPRRATPLC